MSSLYILEIRPLSEVPLANMFSHTVGSLCNLVLFSLAMQKLFILMRSHLFILSFMSLALGDVSVRMLLRGMSEIFLPMFKCSISCSSSSPSGTPLIQMLECLELSWRFLSLFSFF